MNFGELKTAIEENIGRAPSSVCYQLVTADINNNLRLRRMTQEVVLADPYLLPDDFAEAVTVIINESILVPAVDSVRGRVATDIAREYTVSSDRLIIDLPGNDATLKYYAKLSDLALDADTNFVLTNNPSVYVFGVLAHHAALIRDNEALASWRPTYEGAMQNIIRENNMAHMGESAFNIKASASA